LVPNLGVVRAGEVTFTVADVPGLIEGAAEGRGLGHEFLRHIERCAALVHVVDTASIEPGRNPVDDLEVIEGELARYGGLEDRPRLVALNKVDVPDGRDLADITRADIEAKGYRVFEISAASGEGTRELVFAMAELVAASRAEKPAVEPQRIVLRPHLGKGGPDFTITATDQGYVVRGEKPERWVRQTDFNNEEAVGYLADRLNRLGIEDQLVKLGAEEGDTVIIGPENNAVVFDFRPSIQAGAEMLGRRGEDQRFYEERDAAKRRRAIQEAMGERAENETRADVARRVDEGPVSYEIGGEDDPDWAAYDPDAERPE
jgi:GTP-binding protein